MTSILSRPQCVNAEMYSDTFTVVLYATSYIAYKKFMNGCACRRFDPYGAIISTGRCKKIPVFKSAKYVLLQKTSLVLLMSENANNWVHWNYVCLFGN